MSTDDFEQRLRRQSPRRIPPEWRENILSNARAASVRSPATDRRLSLLSTLNRQLSTSLWPSPKAWGGLVAAWLVIVTVQFAVRDGPRTFAEQTTPPSAEVQQALSEQQRLLAELIGSRKDHDADRTKAFAPEPRSEIWPKTAAA